jgi:hypothetical protein
MTEPARIEDDFYDGVDPAHPSEEEDDQGLLAMNPYVLWGLLIPFVLLSAPIVFHYAPESWGVLRKVVATDITGVLAHYCLFINRILVAKW